MTEFLARLSLSGTAQISSTLFADNVCGDDVLQMIGDSAISFEQVQLVGNTALDLLRVADVTEVEMLKVRVSDNGVRNNK